MREYHIEYCGGSWEIREVPPFFAEQLMLRVPTQALALKYAKQDAQQRPGRIVVHPRIKHLRNTPRPQSRSKE